MGFRNRCQVAGAEGVINLSIPLLQGRDQKTLMKDVRIAGTTPWQAQHWKTILACYSRSPWFDFYRDELEGLYQKPFVFLTDWNLACFEWSVRVLEMEVHVDLTDTYRKEYPGEGWLDWRGKLLPKNRKEESKNGEVSGANEPVKYRQVFEERTGFLPNLSILDLLFCEGKRAKEILRAAGK